MSKSASLVRVGFAYVVAVAVGAAWLWFGPDTGHLWLDGLIADTPRDPGDLRVQPSPPQLQLLRRLVERAAASAGDLLVGGRAARVRRRPVLAGRRRDPGLGGAVDRQLGLRVPRVPARGLAVPVAARGQGRHGAAGRPVRDPPGADVAGVPRHDAGLRGGHARRPGRGWIDAVAVVAGLGAVVLELPRTPRCTASRAPSSRGSAWTRGCGAGRGTPTTSARSASGSLSASSVLRHRPRTGGGSSSAPSRWLGLFLGASIPMMEQRSLERRPAYQDVIDRVPRLVPRPPGSGRDPSPGGDRGPRRHRPAHGPAPVPTR